MIRARHEPGRARTCGAVALAALAILCTASAPSSRRGVIDTWQGFIFDGDRARVHRWHTVRHIRPDRYCAETTNRRIRDTGDSVVSHERVIRRLDKRVTWTLDLRAGTYTEVGLDAETEVRSAQGRMVSLFLEWIVSIPVTERTPIAGLQASHYRWRVRPPDADSGVATLDAWIAKDLPGRTVRRSYGELRDRLRAEALGEGVARPDTASLPGWPSDGVALREVWVTEEEPSGPSRGGASIPARAGAPTRLNVRGTALEDSVARAWGMPGHSRIWRGEEVTSMREAEIPDALFEIPAGFKRRALSKGGYVSPWDKAGKRPPPGSKRDPMAPPRLDPFAILTAKRDTPLRAGPSGRHAVKLTVRTNHELDPIELEPVNGYYRVLALDSERRTEGWVIATDVEELGDDLPSNISASESGLVSYAERTNSQHRARVISSIRVEADQVVVNVGRDWSALDARRREGVGYGISYMAAGGQGAARVVFRDSVTSRTVATFGPGGFDEP